MTDMITIECELLDETELAWLVGYEDKTVWVPQSQCRFDDNKLQLPEWMAIEKGLV